MPIVSTDIVQLYSMGASGGAPGASTSNQSLGGMISTTIIDEDEIANNILPDVPSAQVAAAARTMYKCCYVRNDHDSLTLTDAVIWAVNGDPDDPDLWPENPDVTVDVGLDPAATGDPSTTVIGSTTSTPSGVTFAGTAVSKETGLAIGDLAPGEYKAYWIKVRVAQNASLANAKVIFPVEGDTAP